MRLPLLPAAGAITCLLLTACGGSDGPTPSATVYPDDPPPRVSPALATLAIPATLAAPTTTSVALRARPAAAGGIAPYSTANPATVLGGGATTNSFQPGNLPYKLVDGMAGRPLPTGKWYKGFFYQSPRNLADNFDAGGDAIEQSVFALPYRMWLDDRISMVSVGFPRRRFVNEGTVNAVNNFSNPYITDAYPFNVQPDQRGDAFITFNEVPGGRLARRIDHKDELTVTTSWNSGDGARSMQLLAAVGSPYVTVKYRGLQPKIGMGESIRTQLGKNALNEIDPTRRDPSKWEVATNIFAVSASTGTTTAPMQPFLEAGGVKSTPDLTGTKFRFVYSNPDDAIKGQHMQRVMVVYASAPLTLRWDAPTRTYMASAPFTGTLRVAFVDDQPLVGAPPATTVTYADREAILDAHANEYPVSSGLTLEYTGAANSGVTYTWQTEQLAGGAGNGSQLLMMAIDATHLKSMASANRTTLTYRSNFGNMTGLRGGSWTQTLEIPGILRDSPNKELLWHGNGTIKDADKATLLAALKQDATIMKNFITNCNYESYLCGKYVGNIARMVLIADQMENEPGARELRAELLDFLKRNLNPWFDGKDDNDCRVNKAVVVAGKQTPELQCEGPGEGWQKRINEKLADYFQYDTTNGGTVTRRPFAQNNLEQDFYNAIYTDHMFHYGYFIYAAAVVARFDAAWQTQYKEGVNTLVRDIANASLEDKYYPITRTYDWFRMQNIADAGPAANGGNTESSSEAINSGYGIVLWGAATGNGQLQALASVMLAGEIRTAQAFYQVTPASNVFPDVAAVTVPIVGGPAASLALDPATLVTWGIKRTNLTESQVFFGQRRVFRIGIQLLPFTPISEYVFSPAWLAQHRAALLQLEQDETALYDELFTGDPTTLRCSLDALGARSKMPAAQCAGRARVLFNWRQLITSVNGIADPAGAWTRQTGYMAKVPQQTADFGKFSTGTAFEYVDSTNGKLVTGTYAAPGVDPDILKDVSTPSNNSNVLWWLSTRKP